MGLWETLGSPGATVGCARISLEVSEETPVTAQPAQLAAAPPIPGLEAAWTSFSGVTGETGVGTSGVHRAQTRGSQDAAGGNTSVGHSPASASWAGSSDTDSSLERKLRMALKACGGQGAELGLPGLL